MVLCVYVCVCMCIHIYIYIYVYVYTYIYICKHVYGQFSNFKIYFCGLDPGNLKFGTVRILIAISINGYYY